MDQFIKVAGTGGKVGGYFCRLPPLNENTEVLRTNRRLDGRSGPITRPAFPKVTQIVKMDFKKTSNGIFTTQKVRNRTQ